MRYLDKNKNDKNPIKEKQVYVLHKKETNLLGQPIDYTIK